MNPWHLVLNMFALAFLAALMGWREGRRERVTGQPVEGPTARALRQDPDPGRERRLRVVKNDGPGDGPKEAA